MDELILITGINGFIGRYVTQRLIQNGWPVLGISSDPECFIKHDMVLYEQADITDEKRMESIFSQYIIKTVIHLAAIVHTNSSYESYFKVNYKASERTFEFAAKYGVKNIIFASTIEVYGPHLPDSVISEEHEPRPESNYGKTKLLAEQSLKTCETGSLRYAIMRLAPVYSRDFVLNINKRIYLHYPFLAYFFKNGDYSFHLCSVYNIVEFIDQWLRAGKTGIYNISDENPITAKNIILLEKSSGRAYIAIRIPYFVCYGVIWVLEKIRNILGKKDNMISIYNYKKLFQSLRWDNRAMQSVTGKPKWDIRSTLFGSLED